MSDRALKQRQEPGSISFNGPETGGCEADRGSTMANQELEEVFRDYFYSLLSTDAAPGERAQHRDALRHRLQQAGYLSAPDPRAVGIIPPEARERWHARRVQQRAHPVPISPGTTECKGTDLHKAARVDSPIDQRSRAFVLLGALLIALLVIVLWYLPPRAFPALSSTIGDQAAALPALYRSSAPALYRSAALPIYRFAAGGAR